MKELKEIQVRLKAPKDKKNSFGGYNYRSAEGIMEAVKPLLKELDCVLVLSDEIVEVGAPYDYNSRQAKKTGETTDTTYNGTRVYVRATATITNSTGEKVSVTGWAREEVAKSGMDAAQITGAASSYARKYALNGLFCIDDTKDADTDEYARQTTVGAPAQTNGKSVKSAQTAIPQSAPAREGEDIEKIKTAISISRDTNELTKVWQTINKSFGKSTPEYQQLKDMVAKRNRELSAPVAKTAKGKTKAAAQPASAPAPQAEPEGDFPEEFEFKGGEYE